MKKYFHYFLIFLPFLFTLNYFFTFQANVPFADDWSAINGLVLRFFYGNDGFLDKIGLIFAQCNEHREGFVALITLTQFWLFKTINYTSFNLIGILGSLGILMIFLSVLKDSKVNSKWAIPVSFLLFNASYYHNFYWPMSALQHNSVVFFVVLTLALLYYQKSIYYALFFGAMAIFTSGNGFLLFVAAVPLLKKYSKKDWLIWAIAGIILFLLYMYGYEKPVHRNSMLANILLIKELFLTGFAYLGAFSATNLPPSASFRIPLAIVLGVLIASLIVWQLVNAFTKYKEDSWYLFLGSIQLFILFTVGLYSLSRANLPLESVFESRYGINHFLILSSILLNLIPILNTKLGFYFASIFSFFFFVASYFFHSVELLNFNHGNFAAAISDRGNLRDFYFHYPNGVKADLTKPTLNKPNELPKPLVNFTASLPSAGKYYNDVIKISFSQKFYKLPDNLETIYQKLKAKKVDGFVSTDFIFNWDVKKDHISFDSPNISLKTNRAEDSYYLVFRSPSIQPIVFTIHFQETDYRKQLKDPFHIYVRKTGGGVPFKMLPNGRYLANLYQVQEGRLLATNVKKEFDVNN